MHNDNPHRYGTISRFLHWLMAAVFAFMLFTATVFKFNENLMPTLMPWHKGFGFLLIILVIIRIIWAIINSKHRPHGNIVVKLGHIVLYILMFATPFIGLIRQYGHAHGPLKIFGVPVFPAAAEKIDSMIQIGSIAHGKLGWLLFICAAGHIIMTIYHQIKGEKIINRMAGPQR